VYDIIIMILLLRTWLQNSKHLQLHIILSFIMIKLLQLRSSEIAEFIFSIRYIGRRENQDKNIVFNNIFINAYNSITDYGQDIF